MMNLGIDGLSYYPEFFKPRFERDLVEQIDMYPWDSTLSRRTQHYGYRYDYKARSIDESMIAPMPFWCSMLSFYMMTRIPELKWMDQVIVNEYEAGQGINQHVDCVPCFKATIASISLLSPVVMEFKSREDTKDCRELVLEPRSLLVITSDARYKWSHGIPARKVDIVNGVAIQRARRISLTMRQAILQIQRGYLKGLSTDGEA